MGHQSVEERRIPIRSTRSGLASLPHVTITARRRERAGDGLLVVGLTTAGKKSDVDEIRDGEVEKIRDGDGEGEVEKIRHGEVARSWLPLRRRSDAMSRTFIPRLVSGLAHIVFIDNPRRRGGDIDGLPPR